MKATAYEIRVGVRVTMTRDECQHLQQLLVIVVGGVAPDVFDRADRDFAQAMVTIP